MKDVVTEQASKLLPRAEARLAALDQARSAYAERLAPGYNVFDFIRPGELGLSEVIAWLLDPSGSHAQGDRFLQAFVRSCLGWQDFDAARATVRLEAHCGQQRRIDILIESGSAAIAIENKPWAEDQPNQVKDYLAFLNRGYQQH